MNYKQLFLTVKELNQETQKSRLYLFADIIHCGMKYGAGYCDYKLYQFYELNKAQRSTYLTRGKNNKLVKALNDPRYINRFDNKLVFNQLFSDFVKREFLDMRKTDLKGFEAFMENKQEVMLKPINGSCGNGIEKLSKQAYESLYDLYKFILFSKSSLLEEVIVQHKDVADINPYSVNTYRIVTVLDKGTVHIVYAFIRIGNQQSVVDNLNAGGMAAPIDITTGQISCPACDKDGNAYKVHPITKATILGRQLPFWKESLEMCKKAAFVIPQVRYVGWDVAVTADGPLLIEGNPFPGHDIVQLPAHTPNRLGILPKFKSFVKGI